MSITVLLLAGVLAAEPTSAGPIEADIVIRGATIYDGSGGEPVQGDVAVRGDQIVAVGRFEATGFPRIIDAKGLIVAPGFIDLHSHSDRQITAEKTRGNVNFLMQGCTSVVTGNCGGGRNDVENYLRLVDKQGAGTNVLHLVPQGVLRNEVLGDANRPASPAELQRMKQRLAEGLKAGAWGMSSGLIYVPSQYADTAELTELARVVAEHDGIYATHMRNEGTRLLEAVAEALAIGRKSGARVHISHFKASSPPAWGLARDAIALVEEARESGQPVTADQYPYIASSTSLAATVVPPALRSRGELEKALADPQRAADLRSTLVSAFQHRGGGERVVIAEYRPRRDWQGKNLAVIAKEEGKELPELTIEIQRAGGAAIVNFSMSEEEVRLIMQQPFVATASDGRAQDIDDDTKPHPRNYGTFPRKIGRYAIAGKTLPVGQAIRSASGLPADILGLSRRGYLRPGYFADMVVFDPDTFRDMATFDQPHQYAAGVRYLLVNGKPAVDHGKPTGGLHGRALRHGIAAGTGSDQPQ